MFGDLIREVIDYADDVYRNIKGIRESQDLFDDIAATKDDQAVAIAAEGLEAIRSPAPFITRPFDYGTVITYPFIPQNWQRTRFSDGLKYGVWYGSLELETTVYESVHHWQRFLLDSYATENRTIRGERRVFLTRAKGILVDLLGKETARPELVHRSDYSFTNALGTYLQEQAVNGLLVRSARCEGRNAAIFRKEILSGVRDHCHLTYSSNPTMDEVTVERALGDVLLTIRPSSLM